MKRYFIYIVLGISYFGFTQNNDNNKNVELYKDYREDQFYASVTYNLLNNKTDDISQTGFSSGFHFGFIRDMPINSRRNVAVGLGLGISSNSYNQNLSIFETDNNYTYLIIDQNEVNLTKNKFTTYLVELPLELRWRTSTSTDYNFWRIYTGFKVGYLVYNSTKYRTDASKQDLSNIEDFNKLQYGLTLSAGYGTWNFHVYYGLNSIFNANAKLNGEAIALQSLKIGLMFYIL